MIRHGLTIRGKLEKMSNDSAKNTDDITKQQIIISDAEQKIVKLNVPHYQSVVPYNTDGKITVPFSSLIPCTISGYSYSAYKQWTFTYRNLPDYWIDGLNPIIVKKYGEDSTGSLAETTTLEENFTVGIQKDDTNPQNIVNITTIDVVILATSNVELQDDLFVKLEFYYKTGNITST